MGYTGLIKWDTQKTSGHPRKCIDNNKAKTMIGYEASIEIEQGLEKTILWYHEQKKYLK